MSSSTRLGAAPAVRSNLRQPTLRAPSTQGSSSTRTSSVRNSTARHALASSVRPGAVSPTGSTISSVLGAKRKDRDTESEIGSTEETSINVVVRCRGRNAREKKEDSEVVLSTDGVKGNSVDIFMGANALSNKTYTFDRVFSGAADQSLLFDDTVKPMLEEMLKGYNCTIFAYGQTGTGKTYTMSGNTEMTAGMLSDDAGIVPRVLEQLFRKLELAEDQYAVRCSFIELYNEKLRDLLSPDDAIKLTIQDDKSRKGHVSTIVQGMEEKYIHTAAEGIKVLQDGGMKRQVAATKCNDLSSRSHTVFTIATYVRRPNETGGEDLIRAGKLNLVDLAGSESIKRSGAENKRAAEAGMINKSLLSLGRVITALVDNQPHIPYRESELTRLLQDSLGGRTKTCIIATVSPAKTSLEETISTLDYAFRAKNIKNRPQLNAALSKRTLIEEWTREIEKLKSQLITARLRDGVHLTMESYEEMTAQSESRRIVLEEQSAKIETLETNLRTKVQELFSLTSTFAGLKKDHEGTKAQLDETSEVLEQTEIVLSATRESLAQETSLRKAHEQTEEELAGIAKKLKRTISQTTSDVEGLRKKNKRKSDLQSINRAVWTTSQTQVADVTSMIERRLQDFDGDQNELLGSVRSSLSEFKADGLKGLQASQMLIEEQRSIFDGAKNNLQEGEEESMKGMEEVLEGLEEVKDVVKGRVGEKLRELGDMAEGKGGEVATGITELQNLLHGSYSSTGKELKTYFETTIKENTSLRSENEDLRRKLDSALAALAQQQQAFAKFIQETAEEEERNRQENEQKLHALITLQSEASKTRTAEHASAAQKKINELSESLETARTQYGGGMDAWSQKADTHQEALKSAREGLKNKVKDEWTNVSEQCTTLLNTSRTSNAEIVRGIEEHASDLEPQMEALDSFATRAKSQNAAHHETRAQLIGAMAAVVEDSYATTAAQFKSDLDRVHAFSDKMDTDLTDLVEGLEPLDTQIRQPLANLRDEVLGTGLQEYQPTGETPVKTQYSYPTHVPRTRAGSNSSNSSKPQRFSTIAESTIVESTSPTETTPVAATTAHTRRPSSTVVFSDILSPSISSKTVPLNIPLPSSPSSDRNHTITSLRELHPNTTTTSIASQISSADSLAMSTLSLPPSVTDAGIVGGLPASQLVKRGGSRIAKGVSGLKRPAALAGGENVVPVEGVFEQSLGKRKSPRLN